MRRFGMSDMIPPTKISSKAPKTNPLTTLTLESYRARTQLAVEAQKCVSGAPSSHAHCKNRGCYGHSPPPLQVSLLLMGRFHVGHTLVVEKL